MATLTEPFETVTIDVLEEHQGGIMENIGLHERWANWYVSRWQSFSLSLSCVFFFFFFFFTHGLRRRRLIGFQTEFLTLTSYALVFYHTSLITRPHKGGVIGQRNNGVFNLERNW